MLKIRHGFCSVAVCLRLFVYIFAVFFLLLCERLLLSMLHKNDRRTIPSQVLRIHRRLRGKQSVDAQTLQCKEVVPVIRCSTLGQRLSMVTDSTSQSKWFCVGCGVAVSKDLLSISQHGKLCVKFQLCNEADILFKNSQQQARSKTNSRQGIILEASQHLRMTRNCNAYSRRKGCGFGSPTMSTSWVARSPMDEEEVELLLSLLEELTCLLET